MLGLRQRSLSEATFRLSCPWNETVAAAASRLPDRRTSLQVPTVRRIERMTCICALQRLRLTEWALVMEDKATVEREGAENGLDENAADLLLLLLLLLSVTGGVGWCTNNW